MAGLGDDETRLAGLDQEPVGELRGVRIAPVWRASINLRVDGLQLGHVLGGLPALEQPEGHVGRGHDQTV